MAVPDGDQGISEPAGQGRGWSPPSPRPQDGLQFSPSSDLLSTCLPSLHLPSLMDAWCSPRSSQAHPGSPATRLTAWAPQGWGSDLPIRLRACQGLGLSPPSGWMSQRAGIISLTPLVYLPLELWPQTPLSCTCPPAAKWGPHSLAQGSVVLRVLVQELHDVQETLDVPMRRSGGDTASAPGQAGCPPHLTWLTPLSSAPPELHRLASCIIIFLNPSAGKSLCDNTVNCARKPLSYWSSLQLLCFGIQE